MLETVFDLQDITLLKNISKVINSFGWDVYLVGGIVRDILQTLTVFAEGGKVDHICRCRDLC